MKVAHFNSITVRLRWGYIIAFSVLAGMLVLSQIFIQSQIKAQKSDGVLINLAGRQRMLSQKLSKCALVLKNKPTTGTKAEITEVLLDWKKVHLGLKNGDPDLGLPVANFSQYQNQLYTELEPHFKAMYKAGMILVHDEDSTETNIALLTILAHEGHFLENMNLLVNTFENDTRFKIQDLQKKELFITAGSLLIILLEVAFIFRPLLKLVEQYLTRLAETRRQLDIINVRLTNGMEELKRSKKEAEDASVAKSDFLSTMSHEIRTPMNAVIGFTELLLKNNPRPDQLEELRTLQYSGNHLLALINDILDFSKIDGGHVAYEKIVFNLDELFGNAFRILKPVANQKGIILKMVKGFNLSHRIKGDPMRLTQILTNLVGNAIKFTHSGSVEMEYHLAKENADSLSVEFIVRDTGIGIPAEKLDYIFETFTQASSSTTREYGGTGLGLAICKRLVEQQNGKIWVESRVGTGSVFHFIIEFAKADPIPLANTDPELSKNDSKSLNGIRVLLAEDNPINVMFATKLLKRWSVDVTPAGNGKIATELFNKYDFDLVLMDLQMPEMDGYEATKVIRNSGKNRKIPIVALSAYTASDVREQVLSVGFNDYLSKPIDADLLFEAINGLLKTGNNIPV